MYYGPRLGEDEADDEEEADQAALLRQARRRQDTTVSIWPCMSYHVVGLILCNVTYSVAAERPDEPYDPF